MKQITAFMIAFILLVCALPETAMAAYYPGSTVYFGTYEQDGNYYNGQEPIKWRIISMNGNSALLMSEYALDSMPYNTYNTGVSWNTCSLRAWLNGTFMNTAFTWDEQARLLYSGYGYVFLLSSDEVVNYLGSSRNSNNIYTARICYPTQYAINRGTKAYKSGYCWWWLRNQGTGGSNYAASVNSSGSFNYEGDIVDGRQSDGSGVRPCIWVDNVYSLSGSSYTPTYPSQYTAASYEYGLATMKIATRTGPATSYTEPGTFQLQGQYIKLISKAYDSDGVTWLQCEITSNGQLMRVYTGLKRFDQSTFSLWRLSTEQNLWYSTRTSAGFTPRMGPGTQYKAESTYISRGASVNIITEENGWLQFEYDTGIIKSGSITYVLRAWAPAEYFR